MPTSCGLRAGSTGKGNFRSLLLPCKNTREASDATRTGSLVFACAMTAATKEGVLVAAIREIRRWYSSFKARLLRSAFRAWAQVRYLSTSALTVRGPATNEERSFYSADVPQGDRAPPSCFRPFAPTTPSACRTRTGSRRSARFQARRRSRIEQRGASQSSNRGYAAPSCAAPQRQVSRTRGPGPFPPSGDQGQVRE